MAWFLFDRGIRHERVKEQPESYSEPGQTSKMNIFAKIVNGYELFTIFVKDSIVDVWQWSEYITDSSSGKIEKIPWKYSELDLFFVLLLRQILQFCKTD